MLRKLPEVTFPKTQSQFYCDRARFSLVVPDVFWDCQGFDANCNSHEKAFIFRQKKIKNTFYCPERTILGGPTDINCQRTNTAKKKIVALCQFQKKIQFPWKNFFLIEPNDKYQREAQMPGYKSPGKHYPILRPFTRIKIQFVTHLLSVSHRFPCEGKPQQATPKWGWPWPSHRLPLTSHSILQPPNNILHYPADLSETVLFCLMSSLNKWKKGQTKPQKRNHGKTWWGPHVLQQ